MLILEQHLFNLSSFSLIRKNRINFLKTYETLVKNDVDRFVGDKESFYFRVILESYFVFKNISPFLKKITDIGTGIGVPGPILSLFSNFLIVNCFENNPQKILILKNTYPKIEFFKKTFVYNDIFNLSGDICGRASLNLKEVLKFSNIRPAHWLISLKQSSELENCRSFSLNSLNIHNFSVCVSNCNVPRGTITSKKHFRF